SSRNHGRVSSIRATLAVASAPAARSIRGKVAANSLWGGSAIPPLYAWILPGRSLAVAAGSDLAADQQRDSGQAGGDRDRDRDREPHALPPVVEQAQYAGIRGRGRLRRQATATDPAGHSLERQADRGKCLRHAQPPVEPPALDLPVTGLLFRAVHPRAAFGQRVQLEPVALLPVHVRDQRVPRPERARLRLVGVRVLADQETHLPVQRRAPVRRLLCPYLQRL